MVASVMLALASAFLLFGISNILLLGQGSQQPTKSVPNIEPLSDQIFWVIQWIGLAAIITVTIVGAIIFVTRIRTKKHQIHIKSLVSKPRISINRCFSRGLLIIF
jgi:hypothetical protein